MEERSLQNAREFLNARVVVRPSVTESYVSENKEAKILQIVGTAIKSTHFGM